ncbi:MAG: GPW/gp25 family protein [Candidatus Electrothrix aestuarii]|uniref:GPW/gp25 family protein n=1 Tax=Candidatus Electrothrix aestuarii TaxID=3062594 RepID=A0AAU8LV10_9BACT|nr:GPW/gp25 family protein [Candidatus Electrothrix aestuarii]WPD22082.1 MAG: GPW/gp25 family protein [Candidatus Electrothrix sp. GW3-3]
MKEDSSFLGRGWSFPPRFNPADRGVETVAEEEDIRESLRILFSTAPGERIMHPSYGCGLKRMVFESITETVQTEIKDLIERAILFFEPRITLEQVELDATEIFEGKLLILLEYTIRTINVRSNMVYPFYFQEGTLLNP